MPDFIIITNSLNNDSNGKKTVPYIVNFLNSQEISVSVRHMSDFPRAWIDDQGVNGLPKEYQELFQDVSLSMGVIFIAPVYCYAASSILKFVSEAMNKALTRKPVAFVMTAGTIRSHLAVADIMMSMTFEQETFCFPKYSMVTYDDVDDAGCLSIEVLDRIISMVREFVLFTESILYFNYNTVDINNSLKHSDLPLDKMLKKETDFELSLNHINVLSKDVKKSVEFYSSIFGAKYVKHLHDKKQILNVNGFEFFIEEVDQFHVNEEFHIGFRTTKEGVMSFAKKMEKLSIPYAKGNNPLCYPHASPDNERFSVYLKDPSGNTVEVYSPELDQIKFEQKYNS